MRYLIPIVLAVAVWTSVAAFCLFTLSWDKLESVTTATSVVSICLSLGGVYVSRKALNMARQTVRESEAVLRERRATLPGGMVN